MMKKESSLTPPLDSIEVSLIAKEVRHLSGTGPLEGGVVANVDNSSSTVSQITH